MFCLLCAVSRLNKSSNGKKWRADNCQKAFIRRRSCAERSDSLHVVQLPADLLASGNRLPKQSLRIHDAHRYIEKTLTETSEYR